jgi:hypothetical protein
MDIRARLPAPTKGGTSTVDRRRTPQCYTLLNEQRFLRDFLLSWRERFSRAVGEWLSLVEHLVRDQGVGGSNPLSPTNFTYSIPSLN